MDHSSPHTATAKRNGKRGAGDGPLIEMKQISKDYHLGETVVHALRGIDLSIDQGEFVAIWGPSGSGKTTLLNLIGAVDEPTEGSLAIAGKEVRSLSDNRRSELRCETHRLHIPGLQPRPGPLRPGERDAPPPDQGRRLPGGKRGGHGAP